MSIESKEFSAENPCTGEVIWRGASASSQEVSERIRVSHRAFVTWSNRPVAEREGTLRNFESALRNSRSELTNVIAQSTGKPKWESATEVDSMIGKIAISIEAFHDRCADRVRNLPGSVTGEAIFRPHGVCAVFGPFNFPGHLPNGHIVPALLAGNSIVFKPSELTPLVADVYRRIWIEAGGDEELIQIVHGDAEAGKELLKHPINAVFFTGSTRGGTSISKALIDRPAVIQALEMGGNNPLIIHQVSDVAGAAIATIQSAFISAGQRCSCARRLILVGDHHEFLDELLSRVDRIRIGSHDDSPEPFMGPVISLSAAEALFETWENLTSKRPGRVLKPLQSVRERINFLSPGIYEVQSDAQIVVREIFGPILQIIQVDTLDEAIHQANKTPFGLCSGLLSDNAASWEKFRENAHAGVLSWNRPTTGASSALPFGGLGNSGNGRPSAYFAADYCSHPVAIMRSDKLTMPATLPPGLS